MKKLLILITVMIFTVTSAIADYTIYLPTKPGSGLDTWAQVIIKELKKHVDEPIVTQHIPGARHLVGMNKWQKDNRFDDKAITVTGGTTSLNTLVVKGNIKTVKSTKKTFAEEVTATHAKKPTEEQKEEGEEPDRYETLSHILIGKRKYSPDAFDKLKQRAKTLDAGSKELAQLTAKIDSAKSIWEKLSPAGIKRLSDNAFSQKEPTLGKDGKKSHKTISEADYRALPKEEQSQYKSAVNVITTQSGSSSVDVAPMTSYGKGTLSVGQVSAQTLKDDFAKATIECEFFIQTHGRFDMNPVKRGGGNFQLANFVDETKVNINDLLELVELTPSKLIAEMGA